MMYETGVRWIEHMESKFTDGIGDIKYMVLDLSMSPSP